MNWKVQLNCTNSNSQGKQKQFEIVGVADSK